MCVNVYVSRCGAMCIPLLDNLRVIPDYYQLLRPVEKSQWDELCLHKWSFCVRSYAFINIPLRPVGKDSLQKEHRSLHSRYTPSKLALIVLQWPYIWTAKKETGCEWDETSAKDLCSHEERYNQKRPCERISKRSTSDNEDHREKG